MSSSATTKINLIDIGAVGGLDVPWKEHVEAIDKMLCFEPNEPPAHTDRLIKLDTAIWDRSDEMTFHVYGEDGTGSSLLEQNYEWVKEHWDEIADMGDPGLNTTWFERSQEIRRFPCKVTPLDEVLRGLRETRSDVPGRFHFLKSDTQSGEWYVLAGAVDYLADECLGLELELFNKPLYVGVVNEDKVIDHLEQLGFELAGYTPYEKSFLSQRDCLFLKKDPGPEEADVVSLIRRVYGVHNGNKIIKKPSLRSRVGRMVRRFL